MPPLRGLLPKIPCRIARVYEFSYIFERLWRDTLGCIVDPSAESSVFEAMVRPGNTASCPRMTAGPSACADNVDPGRWHQSLMICQPVPTTNQLIAFGSRFFPGCSELGRSWGGPGSMPFLCARSKIRAKCRIYGAASKLVKGVAGANP